MRFGELRIITILQEERNVTVQHLSEIIECSPRTIYRYIEKLNAAGFDIAYENRYVVLKGNNLFQHFFTKKESNCLIDGILNLHDRNLTPLELEILIDKINYITEDNSKTEKNK